MIRGVIVGTAGHVDHGKTSLVRALTGVETDRWAEERERGLTIDIGFAPLDCEDGVDTGIVDVPGHEDFVKNMLAGSTGVDALLLVVAADEGPMPQTREHLTIAGLLGVRHGVVALNKIDRVDDEWRRLARDTTRDELSRVAEGSGWPIVDVSAVTGEGLEELRAELRGIVSRIPVRPDADAFRMPVDRSFSVKGAGTVVTGTTWSGTVAAGQRVRLLPLDRVARVRSLQVHGGERKEVGPGRRCAMSLVGVDTSSVGRGSVVVGPEPWPLSRRLGARVEVPSAAGRDIEHGQRLRLFLGTREIMARIRTEDHVAIREGGRGWAVLDCEQPVVARAGDRFVLRFFSPVTTVGGGEVCALDPPRSWRRQVDHWVRVLDGDPAGSAAAALELGRGRGLSHDRIPFVARVTAGRAGELLEESGSAIRIGECWFSAAAEEEARAGVLELLREAHDRRPRASTESLEALRRGLSERHAPDLVDHVVASMAACGRVVVEGPGIRLPGHEPGLSDAEGEAMRALEEVLAGAGLAPPPPPALAELVGVGRDVLNDLLRLLVERGRIVQVAPEIFVTREAEFRATNIVRELARERAVAPAEFRAALEISRKYLIPLLGHMDRTGVTKRTPEGRVAVEAS